MSEFPQTPRRKGYRRIFRYLPVDFQPDTIAAAAGSTLEGKTGALEDGGYIVGCMQQYSSGGANVSAALFRATMEYVTGRVKLSTEIGGARTFFGDGDHGPAPYPVPIRLPKGQQITVTLTNDSGLLTRPNVTFWVVEYVPTGDKNARVREVRADREGR